jgi:hypothetical protein
MKKLYTLLFVAFAFTTNAQIAQWNFDNVDPVQAKLPTAGAGTFSIIGGVVENLTTGLMPAGNPSTGKAYSIKTFPLSATGSGTAGFQFAVSTVGFTSIVVSFDNRGSNTSSRFQQYEYTTDGTTWVALSNNSGTLANAFPTAPISLTMPAICDNKANFGFRIVSIFDPAGTDYSAVGYMAAPTPSTYSASGAWRIDNVTFTTTTLATKQNSISGLKVYTNNNNLFVTSDSNEAKAVLVYNILGKNVVKTTVTNQAINVTDLASGIYIVKVTENGKTNTVKVVLQ